MKSGESERTDTLVLAWWMMVPALAAILTWMEEALVFVYTLSTRYLEPRWTAAFFIKCDDEIFSNMYQ